MPQRLDALDDLLNAYAGCRADARSTTAAHLRNWSIYAGATASALAMSTSAHASIVYVNFDSKTVTVPHNVPPNWGTSNHTNLNINGLGSLWMYIVFDGPPDPDGSVFLSQNGRPGVVRAGGVNLKDFALNASITAGMQFHQGVAELMSNANGNVYGVFQDGVPGFAGFQLSNGDLGWVRLEWNDSTYHDGYPDHLIAIDAAYNDVAGQSILAGQSTSAATPEPGTMPLALLAAGAIGIAAWKRRRKAA
jgi:hypothetical protein